jgi:GTA TIM-barrel-like domain/Putative phage tail protein
MAELVLSRLGEAAASAWLPKGLAFIGSTVGRIAGSALDSSFLTPPVEGPRAAQFHLTEGREGAGIPIVYGRFRVGAQLIWAANFRERRDVQGGKGGPRVAEYSYSLSFAVGICEGEIARVSRCWANGEPFDLSQVTWRLYRGTEDQAPDPLIEAIEGEVPAYRGLAYIVFEDMPVDAFGARMPQLAFEVVRPAGTGADRMERVARAVNIIPGSGEFSLATDIVKRRIGPGRETAENLHGPELKSDFEASLDQLEAELPNVSRVNLVVAWFGTDLRCGECQIRPGVEIAEKTTVPHAWSVAGIEREGAHLVSATEGRANYGGTPSDESVRQAIALLKARGYHVTLYPFLLMDIPAGNGLPDPHGDLEQAAFPWRGRVTVGTGDVGEQVDAFFERYRPFVLHYAEMANSVGADGLLIGSELVGLTLVTDGGSYPAVEALCALAADARAIVGVDVEVSYAADWTEYGAHVVGDDVAFPLDPLWAHDAITYVGLDWYPPMADWRGAQGEADEAFWDGRALDYVAANIAGGEAFDWYYADAEARVAQARTPISDGAFGEPWVLRQKDIRSWWENSHHPRSGGVRSSTATAWAPGMKPVRFIEMGVPAIDKGTNQPNVFYDPKSSESALPHFSDGSRDDVVQRRAIEAFHAHWLDAGNNPESGVFAGRMVAQDGVALWAWDARPFPAFPARADVWSDAGNWRLGHWLNGRAGAAQLADVIADICGRSGVESDASDLTGVVSGYGLAGPVSARAVLEPLVRAFAVDATERNRDIVFRMRGDDQVVLDPGRFVEDEGPALSLTREGLEQDEVAVRLRFIDVDADYQPGLVRSVGSLAVAAADVEMPLAMDRGQAAGLADELAEQFTIQRERARFAMTADGVGLEAGDAFAMNGEQWRIADVSDGKVIAFEAVRAGPARSPALTPAAPTSAPGVVVPAEPDIVIVDAPPLAGEENDLRPIGFAYAEPWTGAVAFRGGADADQQALRGVVERRCAIGRLISALFPHLSGRWQETSVWVALPGATLASASKNAVLNGANRALVETATGWEMLQFVEAELVDVDTYKLTGLLRGQQGSEAAMAPGAPDGSRIVFLTGAETRLAVADWERGLELKWSAGEWAGSYTHEGSAAQPWSPAHLKARRDGSDVTLTWIRRARQDGDRWTAGEPPLEATEGYRIRVSGGVSVREWDVSATTAIYAAVAQAEDFPAGGSAFIEVAQLSSNGQAGPWTGIQLTILAP